MYFSITVPGKNFCFGVFLVDVNFCKCSWVTGDSTFEM